MKILHVTEYCHAHTTGGTERYILDLVKGLELKGHQNAVVWLAPGHSTEKIEADGVTVFKLPTPKMRVDARYSDFDDAAEQLLKVEKPDWLHFHTFGLTEAGLGGIARKLGIKYAFTYHSPAWTCRRETMLLYGEKPCDGKVDAWRCSACQAQGRIGGSKLAGHAATGVSMAVGWATIPFGRSNLRRRMAFYYDSFRFKAAIESFLSQCDRVISCCEWSHPVLRENGAQEAPIIHCPQGVPNTVAERIHAESQESISSQTQEFTIGCIGRVVEVKGAHILIEAFKQLEAPEARLRIVGHNVNASQDPYFQRLQKLADGDSRIKFVPKLTFDETFKEYKGYSLLAIPSTWLETGPLTLLEALALGVPVYGSNRIGQLAVLQEHGQVVEPNTPEAWQQALTNALLEFRAGTWAERHQKILKTGRLRTMFDVADEMDQIYMR